MELKVHQGSLNFIKPATNINPFYGDALIKNKIKISEWSSCTVIHMINGLLILYMVKYLHIFSYIRKHFLIYDCAADFSLLNLPKGKSLGRSKPATNS